MHSLSKFHHQKRKGKLLLKVIRVIKFVVTEIKVVNQSLLDKIIAIDRFHNVAIYHRLQHKTKIAINMDNLEKIKIFLQTT